MYSFLGTVANIILVKYPKIRESHHATQNPIGTNVKYTQNGASRWQKRSIQYEVSSTQFTW